MKGKFTLWHSIRWRIAVPYVALILATTLGLIVYVSDQVRRARLADLEAQLLADARLMARLKGIGPRSLPLFLNPSVIRLLRATFIAV